VKRICYDRGNTYMLINLNGTYYHYCEIDGETVIGLLHAESVGRFCLHKWPLLGRLGHLFCSSADDG
jgi:KTSC domain